MSSTNETSTEEGTSSASAGSASMTINIRMSTAARFTIPKDDSGKKITKSTTILKIKEMIAAHPSSDNCPVERQRLIFRGRILSEHEKTLEDCGITDDHAVLHLVKGSVQPLGGGTGGTGSSTTPTTSTGSSSAGANTSSTSAGLGSNAVPDWSRMMEQMQQMQSARGGGSNTSNPFDPANMMQQMQNNPMMQQMMNNPEMMQSVLNSPLFNNPDTIMAMLNANPQMRELMDSNPQVRHILSDPAILQQTMQAMRDPQQMQTMMRNQDLAMSQIENYPGGFSALRRMYEEIQEPMMEAMSSGSSQGGNTQQQGAQNSSDSQGGSGAGRGAMPNPWGSTSSSAVNQPSSTTGSSSRSGVTPISNPWAPPSSSSGTGSSSGAGSGTGIGAGTGMPSMMTNSGVPGLPPMSMEQTLAMLENPQVRQMMDQVMANPETMRFMMESNPMLRQMREQNPAAAALMENPDFMRSMMDPGVIRMMMQLQQMQSGVGGNPGVLPMPGIGAGTGTPGANQSLPTGQLDFSSLLNPQMQSMSVSGGSSRPAPPANPQERYQSQVQQLVDMGFEDRDANLQALIATNGNINRAVDRLLGGN